MRTYLKMLVVTFFINLSIIFSFSSGPPDGKTGAPGENTCIQCHQYSGTNGTFQILNVPTNYEFNQSYTITVQLSQQGQSRWGFELTAVDSNGNGAGTFTIIDQTNTQLSDNAEPQRDYVKHTSMGTYNGTTNGPVNWTFQWTAPSSDVGTITFYAAGNAANGNNSSSGDYIYQISVSSNPPVGTPTPVSTSTPTPTSAVTVTLTPTTIYTSTPPPNVTNTPSITFTPTPCELGVTLEMSSHYFKPGDICYLNAYICNPNTNSINVNLFVVLDIGNGTDYWFYPNWVHYPPDINFKPFPTLPFGVTTEEVIPQFNWPSGVGSLTGLAFIGAITDENITQILGKMDIWNFSFGE